MEFAETLRRFIEKSGYVVVNPEAVDKVVQFAIKAPQIQKHLSGIVYGMYNAGDLRLQCINPKDDEAFRLFADEPENPSPT